MADIVLQGVEKVYVDGTRAVADFDLAIEDGEFMVLVGPSGCGKTTALRMVAGLEDVSGGEIRIGGRPVNDVAAKERDIAMVFQTYALYPHMSVYDNMAFGLKLRRLPKADIDARVRRAASMLGLDELLSRKPRALSGGQRQRVAMGRAIVREPQAFLMDEPLSNLDAKLRVQMRAEISRLQRELKVTTIYVTHDQVEAMTMGDRVAVMRKGRLQQVSSPQRLYDEPVNLFVAGFIGSPSMNVVMARVDASGDDVTLRLGATDLVVPPSVLAERPALRAYDGREVICGIRPESLQDPAFAGEAEGKIPGVVALREPLGSEVIMHVEVDARPAATDEVRELSADRGGDVALEQLRADRATLVARFAPGTEVRKGERIDVAVDTKGLHVFDPDTGAAIYRDERDAKGG